MYATQDTAQRTAQPVTSLAAFAYEELKRRLLLGDFRLGRRLAELSLAEQLSISRTPIREALSRLHAEGLVERLPSGGFTPRPPDLHTIAELYEVRRSLEFSALTRGPHDRDALLELRSVWASIERPASDEECGPEFVLSDEEFHVTLASAAGNRSLVEMLCHVNERIRIVRMHDFLTADRVGRTIDEHLGIVGALLEATDPSGTSSANATLRASGLLDEHLNVSERVVVERAAYALGRMISGTDT